jgi:hypothetical protein
MNILNKETLIEAAALGGGVVAGRFVANKAIEKVAFLSDKPQIANAIPAAIGIAGIMFTKNRTLNAACNGMLAASAAYYVDMLLNKFGVTDKQYIGATDAFMSGTQPTFIGNSESMPDYRSDSYDFTSRDAGEFDY